MAHLLKKAKSVRGGDKCYSNGCGVFGVVGDCKVGIVGGCSDNINNGEDDGKKINDEYRKEL